MRQAETLPLSKRRGSGASTNSQVNTRDTKPGVMVCEQKLCICGTSSLERRVTLNPSKISSTEVVIL